MFKYAFPVFFAAVAATASAQPEMLPAPVYDPQGRLIPYDVKPEPQAEMPSRASPKASAKAGKKTGKTSKKKTAKKTSGKKKAVTKKPTTKKATVKKTKRPSAKSR